MKLVIIVITVQETHERYSEKNRRLITHGTAQYWYSTNSIQKLALYN